jgi:SpoVK/Ycf46/Vps4 family AAA+-type ATPase
MYFTDDQLKCPICNRVYVDPRSLPCGENICNKCIQTNEKNGQFNCSGCDSTHVLVDNGFSICRVVASMLKDISKSSLNSIVYEALSFGLREIKMKLDFFDSKIRISHENINEKFELIRNQIDVKTESIIQEIEKCKESLLKDVDVYQSECKKRFQMNKINFQTIKKNAINCLINS